MKVSGLMASCTALAGIRSAMATSTRDALTKTNRMVTASESTTIQATSTKDNGKMAKLSGRVS